jgi:hypothetical protein
MVVCSSPECQTTAGCKCQAVRFPASGRMRPYCPSCKAAAEQWWSYCAMCGHHIAASGPLMIGWDLARQSP